LGATENVTVLFTDLVGSTELSTRLASDAADEVRRAHFEALRRAITASGGIEIKSLGDGLMVTFDAASAALACAVAMQQAVERDTRVLGETLGLRVGLSCGEATREGDDFFGDPVVEAARLCARAEGGQILAADVVRAMAGRRSPHALTPIGKMSLKGFPNDVEVVEVGWQPLAIDAAGLGTVPLPSRLLAEPTIGVVSRDAELAVLTDAFKRVAAGDGREVVLVSGEAGVGKTTLTAKAARIAHAAGACVLLGRCEEALGAPYGPFVEALGHYVGHAPDDLIASHVQSYGAELARMVPALRDRDLPPPQSTDPDTERYLLFGAAVGLLARASAKEPLVLALDDLHWADRPSMQLLRYLVASAEPLRLLIIGTYRDLEISGSHPLAEALAAFHREPGCTRLDLRGLDDAGVVAYVEAAAGHDLDDEGVGLAHAVYRETDGNPFFVGEVLRHLVETGAIYQDDTGHWTAQSDLESMLLPDTVRQVVGTRVAALGDSATRDLALAAVIGREFDVALLSYVSGHSEDELLDVLDAAASRALVREVPDRPGRWTFSHALIQHTLSNDMGATRRARAHRTVAEALEAMYGDRPGERVGELAHHWLNATQPVDADKAIGYARQAAEAALDALAPDDAVRHFNQALQLFGQQTQPDPLLGVDLVLGLGNAQRLAGSAAFRETLLDGAHRAQALGATERIVEAALANNRGYFTALGLVDDDKVAVIEAALEAMPRPDSRERALLLATLSSELTYGPLERRLFLADEAKAMARRLADPATIVLVVTLTAVPTDVPTTLEMRVRDADEAVLLAEALGDPLVLFWASVFRRIPAMQAGDVEVGIRCLERMRALSERLGQPTLLWVTRYNEAAQAIFEGDIEQAEALVTEALQIGNDSGQPDAFAFYGGQLTLLRLQQGRLGELVPLLSQVSTDTPGVPAYTGALALAHLEAGHETDARALLEWAAADGFSALPFDNTWMAALSCYAEVAVGLEDARSAASLLELFAPYHDQVPYTGLTPQEPVAWYLGGLATVLGRYDEAESHFVEAAEANIRGRRKCSEARTQLALGRMLALRGAAGDVERARGLLERARAAAAAGGYPKVEQRATAALSDIGDARPSR
jgi:class 3 adenylate cyclase/tetratricopeptide (TPR) repeat protein